MAKGKSTVERYTNDALATIEREREREIVVRRFGLFDRKETLEQIGELLGITRERVRQLEKAVVSRLKTLAQEGRLPHLNEFQKLLSDTLLEKGSVARLSDLGAELTSDNSRADQARIAFLAELAPELVTVDDSDDFYQAVAMAKAHDESAIKKLVAKIISAVESIGEPSEIATVTKAAKMSDPRHVGALANISKHLANLNDKWGLSKWPMVNPRNIRDKIYVILKAGGKHMHFSEIAEAIKKSEFKRKDVTTQAIHNELIKDKRFVLIGRGIYALKEWGYQRGTVADIITKVLKQEGGPLHRDEIVKRVLKSRFVKETTILLNLQSKPEFKRVAKATYTLTK